MNPWPRWRMPVAAGGFLLAGLPLLAVAEPSPNEVGPDFHLVEKVREHPDHYARLVQDLQQFRSLPPVQQAALRRLDQELHDEDPATTARLTRVMDRYAYWYDHLASADRQKIEAAPDAATRLKVIKQVRERQWIEQLPRAHREELEHLQGQARADRIEQLHKEDKKLRQQWHRAFKDGLHGARADGTPDVSDRALFHFALTELTPKERDDLHLTPADPSSRERLREEYLKRHPEKGKQPQPKDEPKKKDKP